MIGLVLMCGCGDKSTPQNVCINNAKDDFNVCNRGIYARNPNCEIMYDEATNNCKHVYPDITEVGKG